MFNLLKTVLLVAIMLFLVTACGKGEDPAGNSSATVSGVVAKGLVNGGTVNITDLNGNHLASGITNIDGSYSIDIVGYQGPVIVSVAGGTYLDEATGNSTLLANTMASGMRAVFGNASGLTRIAVTPLTDIAYQRAAAAGLNVANIAEANNAVSVAFGIDNILTTMPGTPVGLPSGTLTAPEKYLKALTAISRRAQTAGASVANTITADFITLPIICSDATTCPFNAATQALWTDEYVDKPTTLLSSARTTALASIGDKNLLYVKGAANGTQVTFTISGLPQALLEGDLAPSKTVITAADPISGVNVAKTHVYSSTPGTATVKASFATGSTATTLVSFVDVTGQVVKSVKLTPAGAAKLTSAVTAMKLNLVSAPDVGTVGIVGSTTANFTTLAMLNATTLRAELSQAGGVNLDSINPLFTIAYGFNPTAPTSFAVSPVGTVTLLSGGPITLVAADFIVE